MRKEPVATSFALAFLILYVCRLSPAAFQVAQLAQTGSSVEGIVRLGSSSDALASFESRTSA